MPRRFGGSMFGTSEPESEGVTNPMRIIELDPISMEPQRLLAEAIHTDSYGQLQSVSPGSGYTYGSPR